MLIGRDRIERRRQEYVDEKMFLTLANGIRCDTRKCPAVVCIVDK